MTDRADADHSSLDAQTPEMATGQPGPDALAAPLPGEAQGAPDPQMASRLAEDVAALAEAASRPEEDLASLVSEEEREPALGFYLALATMVAVLLLVVFGVPGVRRPVEEGAGQTTPSAHPPPVLLIHPPSRALAPRLQPALRVPPPGELRSPVMNGTPGSASAPSAAGSSGPFGGRPAAGSSALPPVSPPFTGGPASAPGALVPNRVSPATGAARRVPNDTLELPGSPLLTPVGPDSAATGAAPAVRARQPALPYLPQFPEGGAVRPAQATPPGGAGLPR